MTDDLFEEFEEGIFAQQEAEQLREARPMAEPEADGRVARFLKSLSREELSEWKRATGAYSAKEYAEERCRQQLAENARLRRAALILTSAHHPGPEAIPGDCEACATVADALDALAGDAP